MARSRRVCPLCRERRGKRLCPAKGEEICPHCCGTKRRVEIECPEDCVYLAGAHAGAWEGRETERNRDARRVAPYFQRLAEGQGRLFFLVLSGIGSLRARRRDLDDRLLGQAVSALRKTAETRASGLIYEHPPEDMRAQGLVHELAQMFEAKDEAGSLVSPADRDLLPVLVALDECVTAALAERAGPTVFLDTATRLVGRFQGAPSSGSRPLIIQP